MACCSAGLTEEAKLSRFSVAGARHRSYARLTYCVQEQSPTAFARKSAAHGRSCYQIFLYGAESTRFGGAILLCQLVKKSSSTSASAAPVVPESPNGVQATYVLPSLAT